MLGKYHVLIAFLITGVLLFNAFDYRTDQVILYILLLGIIAGSLLPDALDATDSAMRYKKMRGKEMKYFEFFTVINPLLAGISKVLAFPLTFILKKRYVGLKFRHRGIWHSLLGVSIISLSWFIPTILFILLCFFLFPEMDTLIWLIFPIGLFTGSLIHLLEDSFTVSGINWMYPLRKFHVSGRIKTIGKYDPHYKKLSFLEKNDTIFYYFLVFSVLIFFLVEDIILIFLAVLLEVGLAGLIFGVRIETT
ncbi:MAG: hypothetical protein DRO76_01880 [Candidatus Altiarchaeales archaeon]|nr:MAG: hypothetical protein DRO76_01880 [Candidatus Altiarchaeales archaeon]